ncbi:shikimate dehydrogenase (NADP+) [Oceaniferula spumae]|uniref:Shikimate dehydrogenase (NADP(+)) n=1 Tax=Oceaniferula spumae TaxID=2979115 RepID=A0AAT9FHS2_9BACT
MKDVYQISDLESRDLLDEGAEKPARLAVIGNPVAHSASPAMHQAALDAGDMDMRYIRLEVEPGQVAEAFSRMAELGFIGCNVTVPHKLEAMECCDEHSEDALAIGVVNTVLFPSENNSKTIGHNTDGPGLARAIREEFSVDLADLRVMIVGVGGGAGRAIATQCARLGCEQLWLVNRTLEKAETLAEELHQYYDHDEHLQGPGDQLCALGSDDDALIEAAGRCALIINATSLGMRSIDPLPLPRACIQPHHMVYDAIYKPAETGLLKQAKSVNASAANGLSMLLHQGVFAFEFWFPGQSPTEAMRRGLSSTL